MSRNVELTRSRWISGCRRSAGAVDDDAKWKMVRSEGFHSTPVLSFFLFGFGCGGTDRGNLQQDTHGTVLGSCPT